MNTISSMVSDILMNEITFELAQKIRRALNINKHLTSTYALEVSVDDMYSNSREADPSTAGFYIKLEGTRSGVNFFYNNNLEIARKPSPSKAHVEHTYTRLKGFEESFWYKWADKWVDTTLDEALPQTSSNTRKPTVNEYVKSKWGDYLYSVPVHGPSYITPDGEFINIAEIFDDMGEEFPEDFPCHGALQSIMVKDGVAEVSGRFDDGSPALRDAGYIRVNDIEEENNFIELSPKRPTTKQYIALESWLDNNYNNTRYRKVAICTPKFGDCHEYSYRDYITDDIIKRIKRYYTTGNLIEKIIKKSDGYYVTSEDGKKNLGGPYDNEDKAKERLQQVHYFKDKKNKDHLKMKEAFPWDEEDSFFTREDIDEFTSELQDNMPEEVVIGRGFVEPDNMLEVDWSYEGYEETSKIKIDMRKIKLPSDLIKRFLKPVKEMIDNRVKEIDEENAVGESLKEAEGRRLPGFEYIIFELDDNGEYAPIKAIRSTRVEAEYLCAKLRKAADYDTVYNFEKVPKGKFHVGDDFWGPFDDDCNKLESIIGKPINEVLSTNDVAYLQGDGLDSEQIELAGRIDWTNIPIEDISLFLDGIDGGIEKLRNVSRVEYGSEVEAYDGTYRIVFKDGSTELQGWHYSDPENRLYKIDEALVESETQKLFKITGRYEAYYSAKQNKPSWTRLDTFTVSADSKEEAVRKFMREHPRYNIESVEEEIAEDVEAITSNVDESLIEAAAVEKKAGTTSLGRKAVKLDDSITEAEKLASNLPQTKYAKEVRRKYVEEVYHTYRRELKPIGHTNAEGKLMVYGDDNKNEMYLETKYISSALDGNLASWYANEVRIDDFAPREWRLEVDKMIENKFKSAYSSMDVPSSFAANYPNMSGSQLLKKYSDSLKESLDEPLREEKMNITDEVNAAYERITKKFPDISEEELEDRLYSAVANILSGYNFVDGDKSKKIDTIVNNLLKNKHNKVDESLTESIAVGDRYIDTAKGRRCKVVDIKDVNREKHNSLGSFKDTDVVIEYDNDKSRTYTFKKGEFNVRFKKESLNEAQYSYLDNGADEKLVRDSYNHFVNDLGITPTVDDIFEDIMTNYDQDMFEDDSLEGTAQAIKDIRAILRRLDLEYLDESLKEGANGSVEDYLKQMKKTGNPEKVMKDAKGNPNAEKAYKQFKEINDKSLTEDVYIASYSGGGVGKQVEIQAGSLEDAHRKAVNSPLAAGYDNVTVSKKSNSPVYGVEFYTDQYDDMNHRYTSESIVVAAPSASAAENFYNRYIKGHKYLSWGRERTPGNIKKVYVTTLSNANWKYNERPDYSKSSLRFIESVVDESLTEDRKLKEDYGNPSEVKLHVEYFPYSNESLKRRADVVGSNLLGALKTLVAYTNCGINPFNSPEDYSSAEELLKDIQWYNDEPFITVIKNLSTGKILMRDSGGRAGSVEDMGVWTESLNDSAGVSLEEVRTVARQIKKRMQQNPDLFNPNRKVTLHTGKSWSDYYFVDIDIFRTVYDEVAFTEETVAKVKKIVEEELEKNQVTLTYTVEQLSEQTLRTELFSDTLTPYGKWGRKDSSNESLKEAADTEDGHEQTDERMLLAVDELTGWEFVHYPYANPSKPPYLYPYMVSKGNGEYLAFSPKISWSEAWDEWRKVKADARRESTGSDSGRESRSEDNGVGNEKIREIVSRCMPKDTKYYTFDFEIDDEEINLHCTGTEEASSLAEDSCEKIDLKVIDKMEAWVKKIDKLLPDLNASLDLGTDWFSGMSVGGESGPFTYGGFTYTIDTGFNESLKEDVGEVYTFDRNS